MIIPRRERERGWQEEKSNRTLAEDHIAEGLTADTKSTLANTNSKSEGRMNVLPAVQYARGIMSMSVWMHVPSLQMSLNRCLVPLEREGVRFNMLFTSYNKQTKKKIN